jgi:transcriptional regulator with XRE-family HTH domain
MHAFCYAYGVIVISRLRPLRERKALTQRELARDAGVTQSTIQRLEAGLQEARPSTIRKLARALGVKPVDLMDIPPTLDGL